MLWKMFAEISVVAPFFTHLCKKLIRTCPLKPPIPHQSIYNSKFAITKAKYASMYKHTIYLYVQIQFIFHSFIFHCCISHFIFISLHDLWGITLFAGRSKRKRELLPSVQCGFCLRPCAIQIAHQVLMMMMNTQTDTLNSDIMRPSKSQHQKQMRTTCSSFIIQFLHII